MNNLSRPRVISVNALGDYMALDSRPETAQVAFALNHYRHLKKLHRYVLLNADKPLKLSVVAAHVGISPSRLSRLFQQKAGITYSTWLRVDRISARGSGSTLLSGRVPSPPPSGRGATCR